MFDLSAELLRKRVDRIQEAQYRCEDAENLNSLGWAELLARQTILSNVSTLGIGTSDLPDPQKYFEHALQISEDRDICPEQTAEDINSLINLALLALSKDQPSAAKVYLAQAAVKRTDKVIYQMWLELIRAQLAQSDNDPKRAIKHYEQLQFQSEKSTDRYLYCCLLYTSPSPRDS